MQDYSADLSENICCHCDSLVRASEVVEPPGESPCLHAVLLQETGSWLPVCSGAEAEEENVEQAELRKTIAYETRETTID